MYECKKIVKVEGRITPNFFLKKWFFIIAIIITIEFCRCCCCITSVVSDSVQPHRWQPTRLPRPWDSPGKNTGVGSHFLLQCMKVKSESEVAQSCPTLSDPMDCSLPGSSIHGIVQYWKKSTGVGCHCLLKTCILHHIKLTILIWTIQGHIVYWKCCLINISV